MYHNERIGLYYQTICAVFTFQTLKNEAKINPTDSTAAFQTYLHMYIYTTQRRPQKACPPDKPLFDSRKKAFLLVQGKGMAVFTTGQLRNQLSSKTDTAI